MSEKPWLLLDVDGVINILQDVAPEDLNELNMSQVYVETDSSEYPIVYHGFSTLEAYEKFMSDYADFKFRGAAPPTRHIYSVTFRNDLPEMLQRLAKKFNFAWATTWEHGANQFISPLLGIPEDLPVITFDNLNTTFYTSIYAKTPRVSEWADGAPFIWLDDNVSFADQNALEYYETFSTADENTDVPPRQVARNINYLTGISEEDVEFCLKWAEQLNF